jgi:hypothetical protein
VDLDIEIWLFRLSLFEEARTLLFLFLLPVGVVGFEGLNHIGSVHEIAAVRRTVLLNGLNTLNHIELSL